MTLRALAIALAFAAVGLAGCGDGGPDAETAEGKRVERALSQWATRNDPETRCVAYVTDDFVRTVYGTVQVCKTAQGIVGDRPATNVKLTDLRVDGAAAVGVATLTGGKWDGTKGTVTFAKVGTWRIDGFGVEFLRSMMIAEYANFASNTSTPLGDSPVSKCMKKRLRAVPPAQVRAFAHDALRGRDITRAGAIVQLPCGLRGIARRAFERELRRKARSEEIPTSMVNCIIRRLRRTLTEEAMVAGPSGKGAQAVAQTTTACRTSG